MNEIPISFKNKVAQDTFFRKMGKFFKKVRKVFNEMVPRKYIYILNLSSPSHETRQIYNFEHFI